jgi:hypothetical protein
VKFGTYFISFIIVKELFDLTTNLPSGSSQAFAPGLVEPNQLGKIQKNRMTVSHIYIYFIYLKNDPVGSALLRCGSRFPEFQVLREIPRSIRENS